MASQCASKSNVLRTAFASLAVLSTLLLAVRIAQAQTEAVLYSFGGHPGDGTGPVGGVILDSQENLYGTTCSGGVHDGGTAFKLTPTGAEVLLYSFESQFGVGSCPYAGLIFDKRGNLYGTTNYGGTYGLGTVFKIAPDGVQTILHSFGYEPGDGKYPLASLIFDKQGNLYGTTTYGGASGVGTVFKLSPSGTEAVLHSFGGEPGDGINPQGALILDKQGNLYGTTAGGGAYGGAYGHGMVFKLSSSGEETLLHSFGGQSADGILPLGSLIFDKQGDLYGTTSAGGAYGWGTIFKLDPSGTETVLYSFGSLPTDAMIPYAGLISDKKGNLYGTSIGGGAFGQGTVFKLAPTGTEIVLYSFDRESGDGINPSASLLFDKQGNLYGTTPNGGAYGYGTVFELIPYPTTTSLISSTSPSVYGQKVTWTATVTTSGSVPPTGKVNFTWGNSIGTVMLNGNGVAALTRSNLNAGTYPLTAVYVGDAANSPGTSSVLNQVVLQTTTSATLTSSPNPSTQGQAVTFTAKITSPTVIPTGPVTFTAGKTALGTAQLSGGKAKFTISTLAVGSTKVTATYYGNSNIAKSSASVTQTVH